MTELGLILWRLFDKIFKTPVLENFEFTGEMVAT